MGFPYLLSLRLILIYWYVNSAYSHFRLISASFFSRLFCVSQLQLFVAPSIFISASLSSSCFFHFPLPFWVLTCDVASVFCFFTSEASFIPLCYIPHLCFLRIQSPGSFSLNYILYQASVCSPPPITSILYASLWYRIVWVAFLDISIFFLCLHRCAPALSRCLLLYSPYWC